MIKKLVPFLYCLTPMCVFAVDDVTIPGTPGRVTQISGSLNLTDASYIFQKGSGIRIGGLLSTAGGVFVGYDAILPLVPGSIYAESGISNNYSILTGGSISIGQTLNIAAGKNLTIGGAGGNLYNFTADAIEAYGSLRLYGNVLTLEEQFVASGTGNVVIEGKSLRINGAKFQALDSKNVTVNLGTGVFNISNGSIENLSTGTMSLNTGAIVAQYVTNESNSGTLNINATSLNLTDADATANVSFVNKGNFFGVVSGATTFAHGVDLSTMNATNVFSLTTGTLSLGASVDTFFDNNLNSFTLNVTNGAINANTIRNGYTNTDAGMNLSASTAINASGIVANGGTMNLSAPNIAVGNGGISVAENGRINVLSAGTITSGGALSVYGTLSAGLNTAASGGMNIVNGFTDIDVSDFDVNVGGMWAGGSGNGFEVSAQTINVTNNVISSNGGQIVLSAETVNIGGNVGGYDVTISNPGLEEGINVTVGGSILGGTDIIGLASMTVGGNYVFDTNSRLVAFANENSGDLYTYWATATFDEENEVATIINDIASAEPLISISGQLITNVDSNALAPDGSPLLDSQIGINLRNTVTGGSAIWLMYADEGIQELATRIAGLSINFCNADGTICMDYLAASNMYNGGDEQLPIHLVSYDTDGDGVNDSLYVVFDDQFVEQPKLFKLQPIVASAPYYTRGEYQSAGALDDLIEHMLLSQGFTYDSPLWVSRILFDDTVLYHVSEELYQRMNYYWLYNKPDVIRAFSRVFQLREANQIADMLELNTHTVFKDLSDRFIDEAIWNRNRRLNKAWFVADYGYFWDDLVDNHAHGSRFGFTFGYDWQSSKTLILGWMGHVAHNRGQDNDVIDLGYGNVRATGHVDTDVRNLNIAGGAYFMKTLGIKARWYGDAMLHMNFIDVARDQTWLDNRIEGDAMSFGIVGETGLIHDWLNQYVIGNLYLRLGYNSGFDMTETTGGVDYMNLDFDGRFILTPGYSLTAQKRFYPSAWFQLRPYATVGIEYDLIASPDTMKYKFAVVTPWRDYDIGVDPLWAHIGAGVEFLSVNGVHVGIDYRYQYNANVQMHKVHLSGMYRF